jgi:hypothetical protein
VGVLVGARVTVAVAVGTCMAVRVGVGVAVGAGVTVTIAVPANALQFTFMVAAPALAPCTVTLAPVLTLFTNVILPSAFDHWQVGRAGVALKITIFPTWMVEEEGVIDATPAVPNNSVPPACAKTTSATTATTMTPAVTASRVLVRLLSGFTSLVSFPGSGFIRQIGSALQAEL